MVISSDLLVIDLTTPPMSITTTPQKTYPPTIVSSMFAADFKKEFISELVDNVYKSFRRCLSLILKNSQTLFASLKLILSWSIECQGHWRSQRGCFLWRDDQQSQKRCRWVASLESVGSHSIDWGRNGPSRWASIEDLFGGAPRSGGSVLGAEVPADRRSCGCWRDRDFEPGAYCCQWSDQEGKGDDREGECPFVQSWASASNWNCPVGRDDHQEYPDPPTENGEEVGSRGNQISPIEGSHLW